MVKKQFKAESKRLLDIMINSIYTHKEIFLRELISNASDALDKRHYILLTDKNKENNNEELSIRIIPDKKERTLTIVDTGIGMNKNELEENLGIIAKSGSLSFKLENNIKDKNKIIGQFGVGFYSAFMIAQNVEVISMKHGENQSYKWVSSGTDGYSILVSDKKEIGTTIILKLKDNTKDENYSEYLEENKIKELIKKYSNFIKYPIILKDETINSMTPIWRKKKKELSNEDYENFYNEQKFGFDKPLKVIHYSVDGTISYDSLLYIPSEIPFDFYTKEFQKGLALYSNNVLIMDRCSDLLPDYFGFVKGLVDSPDVSLNISRELLQHDKQLQTIAKNVKEKIKKELLNLLTEERDKYETFFKTFGKIIKYGVYNDWGVNKEFLQDLLMFYSSKEKKLITLDEYILKINKEQKYIYYATGSDIKLIDKLPQVEGIKDKDYEILYLTEEVDEFAIKILGNYKDKEFQSVSNNEKDVKKEKNDKDKEIFDFIKETLKDKVTDVKATTKLKNHPACLTSEGEISIEMEKILKAMPNSEGIKANKILEINTNHNIFKTIKDAYKNDKEKLKTISKVLYNQSLLIEGLNIEDPIEYANDVYNLIN